MREAETRPKRRKERKRNEARKKEGMKQRGEGGREGGSGKRVQTSAQWTHLYRFTNVDTSTGGDSESQL